MIEMELCRATHRLVLPVQVQRQVLRIPKVVLRNWLALVRMLWCALLPVGRHTSSIGTLRPLL